MHVSANSPPAPAGRSLGHRLLGLLGRLVALALVVGAGLGGWLAVDRLVVAEPVPWGVIPVAGEGLPGERLAGVDLPRAFRLDVSGPAPDAPTESRWFDLDLDVIVSQSGVSRRELHAGRGFERTADGAWTEMARDAALAARRSVSAGSGPFLLTDIVPPAGLPHVSIVADEMIGATSGTRATDDQGLRRITLAVDVAGFRDADPVGFARWRSIRLTPEPARQRWTVDVAHDGIVRRLDQNGVVRTWTPLVRPVPVESPLSLDVAADSVSSRATTTPAPADAGP